MKFLFIFYAGIMLLFSCKPEKKKEGQVKIITVRDEDTLHVRIFNNTRDTIYVAENYTGTYNLEKDTIFLEVVDKPEFGSDIAYRYSNIFPFTIYLAKKLPGKEPDTAIQTIRQVYYYYEFLVRPFVAINPGSSFYEPLVFYVPGRARTVQAVYYTKPFLKNNKTETPANYTVSDWIRFDSLNARYTTVEILDRVYVN